MSEAKRSEAKRGGGGGVVHEYEEGLLGGELDALADHVLELTDCEVGGSPPHLFPTSLSLLSLVTPLLVQQCAFSPGFCDNFPAAFEIEHVRVYQREGETLGCSTREKPTKLFIEGHKSRYMTEEDREPLLPINVGGGVCGEGGRVWGGGHLQRGILRVHRRVGWELVRV